MKSTEINLDIEVLIKQMGKELRSGKPLTGTGGIFTPRIKKVIESSLEGEMDAHLEQEGRSSKNRRNGRGEKMSLVLPVGWKFIRPVTTMAVSSPRRSKNASAA